MARRATPSRRALVPPLELEIRATTASHLVPPLRSLLTRAHRLAASRVRRLSVALVGRRLIRTLNKRFLGHDRVTDVICFPLDLDHNGRAIAGEIVLCVPLAFARARRLGLPVLSELLLYAVHGLLHLDGWQDNTNEQFAAMHSREDKILSQMGLGAVFSAPASAGSSSSSHSRG